MESQWRPDRALVVQSCDRIVTRPLRGDQSIFRVRPTGKLLVVDGKGGRRWACSSLTPPWRLGDQDITGAGQQLLRNAAKKCRLQLATAVRSHCKKVGIESVQRTRDGMSGRALANLDGKLSVAVE